MGKITGSLPNGNQMLNARLSWEDAQKVGERNKYNQQAAEVITGLPNRLWGIEKYNAGDSQLDIARKRYFNSIKSLYNPVNAITHLNQEFSTLKSPQKFDRIA